MTLINKIGKGLALGAMLGTGVVFSGCNQIYINGLSRGLAENMMLQAGTSYVQNEIEGPRGTTVNVYGQERAREPRLVIWEWRDANGDRYGDPNEMVRRIDMNVDISKYGLGIGIPGKSTPITFIFYDSENTIVKKYSSNNNCMMINKNGAPSGKFNIVAKFGDNQSVSKSIRIK